MGFIDRPQQVRWRTAVFQIHLWVGILLVLYVVIISVTGCVLIFGKEITDNAPSISHHDIASSPLALGSLVAVAQQLYPGYQLNFIEDGSWRGKAFDVALFKGGQSKDRRDRSIYFDPFTGQILANRDVTDGTQGHPLYRAIAGLHVNLLSGSVGYQINGICGAFLLVLCVTGIVIWWSGRKTWSTGLTVRWAANWKRINYDSHRALGFWALLMISMWAVTGIYLAFAEGGYARPIDKTLARIFPFAAPVSYPKTKWEPGEPILPISDLYLYAQRALPGERIRSLGFPQRAGGMVFASFYPSRSPKCLHLEIVYLDPTTGANIHIRDSWKESRVGNRLIELSDMLHFVEFDSLPLKISFALVGFSPAVLAITGALMWWNRVLSKKWTALRNAPQ